MNTVVISPHLDDAVLSCSTLLEAGPTKIITIFSGPPVDHSMLGYYDEVTGATSSRARVFERTHEDHEALDGLVESVVRLPFKDAQYLQSPTAAEVADAIAINLLGADRVVFPSALGGHSDHRLARDACVLGVAEGLFPECELTAFADYPYASEADGWPAWVRTSDPMGLHVDADWDGELAVLAECGFSLTPVVRRLDDAAIDRKLERSRLYRTQFDALDNESGRVSSRENLMFEVEFKLSTHGLLVAPEGVARELGPEVRASPTRARGGIITTLRPKVGRLLGR